MDVALVVMPFADMGRPALGVSLLKQAAVQAGFSASVRYFNLTLAQSIGSALYQKISNAFPPELLLGEWYFADAVFGDELPCEEEYLGGILAPFADDALVAVLLEARRHCGRYLDAVAAALLEEAPAVVGFTTTFHQTCASLAVARRLKAAPRPPIVVFGGANCEGEMGLQMLQSFPWIDHVCSGEADDSFVPLLEHLLRGARQPPAGVLARGAGAELPAAQAVADLDTLPMPDFDDYFAQLSREGLGRECAHHLVVETSRGCWWGAKHHCTFCGLNGETMKFRSKSPERAVAEIDFLCRRYGMRRIGCVDNILDMHYIDTVFPALAAGGLQLELFYEVKSNLRLDQLQRLKAGGMTQIQPGIESFSDEVLRLMDKGVTGFQNLQLLRWCSELGLECSWNLLAGFPGESRAEYDWMAALAPLLTHLDAPGCCAPLRLDRFSPFHARPQAFGLTRLRPARAYFYVFPLGRRELARLAYFFDFDYADGRDPSGYMRPLQQAVQGWWRARTAPAGAPRLDLYFEPEGARIEDTRPVARAAQHRLGRLQARLLALADVACTLPTLLRGVEPDTAEAELRQALDELIAQGLMVCRDGRYLTLAVFRNRPSPPVKPLDHARIQPAQAAAASPLHAALRPA